MIQEFDVPHIYKHGVVEHEVKEVLEQPGEDRPGKEDSRVAIGQTQAGRHLRVIYVPDPELNSVFVITAYELQANRYLPIDDDAVKREENETSSVSCQDGMKKKFAEYLPTMKSKQRKKRSPRMRLRLRMRRRRSWKSLMN